MMETIIKAGQRTFLPAAGHDLFLPLYDSIAKLTGADRARSLLLQQAALRPGQRVLDIGCGTGTLAVLVKRQHPQVEMVGLDPDFRALERAKRKARRAAVPVGFDCGFADCLPYRDSDFDVIFSSFMLHHLDTQTKEKMFAEVRRVLKPGCHLHLVDFGGPDSAMNGTVSRWLHTHHRLKENSEATVLSLMAAGGLIDGEVVTRERVLLGFGRALYYRASSRDAGHRR